MNIDCVQWFQCWMDITKYDASDYGQQQIESYTKKKRVQKKPLSWNWHFIFTREAKKKSYFTAGNKCWRQIRFKSSKFAMFLILFHRISEFRIRFFNQHFHAISTQMQTEQKMGDLCHPKKLHKPFCYTFLRTIKLNLDYLLSWAIVL